MYHVQHARSLLESQPLAMSTKLLNGSERLSQSSHAREAPDLIPVWPALLGFWHRWLERLSGSQTDSHNTSQMRSEASNPSDLGMKIGFRPQTLNPKS